MAPKIVPPLPLTVDALRAMTGWNRYHALGYLTVWRQSVEMAGIESTDINGAMRTLPDQVGRHMTEPRAIIDLLVRTGEIQFDGHIYTLKKGRGKASVAKRCDHWSAYADAYIARHGKPPLRGKKANAQLKQIEDQVPCASMDRFLRFYVGHDDYKYTSVRHDLGRALMYVGPLHTDMLKNEQLSNSMLRQDATRHDNRSQLQRIARGELG